VCERHQPCAQSAARHIAALVAACSVAAAALLPDYSSPSLDAQRARLERVMSATTAVLFAASVSYIVLSTLFSCVCSRRRPQGPDAGPVASAIPGEIKRAFEEIPVVVVVAQARDDDPGGCRRSREGSTVEEECAVCLAEYARGEEVRVLPACRHGFHRECVDRWLLTRAPTCPVCRAAVTAAGSEGRDAKACATGDHAVPPAVL
jgi:hypothetical protein